VLDAIMPTCKPGNTGVPPLSDPTCFGNYGGTYTYPEMDACTIPPTVNEDVGWTYGEVDNPVGGVLTYGGVLDKLPGCNPIQPGPGMASVQTCSGSSPSSTSTISSSPTGAPPGWTFLGCYTDNVSGRTLNYGIPAPGGPSTMTVEACLSGCQALGYQYAGVEYADECCKCLLLKFVWVSVF
jgi:WSC domain